MPHVLGAVFMYLSIYSNGLGACKHWQNTTYYGNATGVH